MNIAAYPLTEASHSTYFRFTSEGPKGQVVKEIQITVSSIPGVCNLGFGDLNLETGEVDDSIVTNNGDTDKVLATVVDALRKFFERYPLVAVYAIGSDHRRNRLYQIGINRFYESAVQELEILGLSKEGWEHFAKGRKYNAFLVRKRFTNLPL